MKRCKVFAATICLICGLSPSTKATTEEEVTTKDKVLQSRMNIYFQYEGMLMPWYYLAAIDQYERNIQDVRTDIPKRKGVIAIQFSDEYWSGPLNPKKNDTSPYSIKIFDGMGLDGNGDGLANKNDDEDVMYTLATYLNKYGSGEEKFKSALWDYYRNELAVNQILVVAKLYQKFGTIDLDTHTFPIVLDYEYRYTNTWGANRGGGGRRTHEGTDIYAGYGTPVVSASYGVIEEMGWNQFGGWRIGIRDNHNSYHYYAHLGSFHKGLKLGDIVKTGQIIGYVGSTGYGKEGTAGKFPPHLHYGIYKLDGRTEWAFNPYPSLVQWEKEARKAKNS